MNPRHRGQLETGQQLDLSRPAVPLYQGRRGDVMTAHAPAPPALAEFQHGRMAVARTFQRRRGKGTGSPALLLTTTVSTCYVWGQDGRLKEFRPDKNFGFQPLGFQWRGIDLNRDRATDMVIAAACRRRKRNGPYTYFYSFKGGPASFRGSLPEKKPLFLRRNAHAPAFMPVLVGPGLRRHRSIFARRDQMVKSGGGFGLGAGYFTACRGKCPSDCAPGCTATAGLAIWLQVHCLQMTKRIQESFTRAAWTRRKPCTHDNGTAFPAAPATRHAGSLQRAYRALAGTRQRPSPAAGRNTMPPCVSWQRRSSRRTRRKYYAAVKLRFRHASRLGRFDRYPAPSPG